MLEADGTGGSDVISVLLVKQKIPSLVKVYLIISTLKQYFHHDISIKSLNHYISLLHYSL